MKFSDKYAYEIESIVENGKNMLKGVCFLFIVVCGVDYFIEGRINPLWLCFYALVCIFFELCDIERLLRVWVETKVIADEEKND